MRSDDVRTTGPECNAGDFGAIVSDKLGEKKTWKPGGSIMTRRRGSEVEAGDSLQGGQMVLVLYGWAPIQPTPSESERRQNAGGGGGSVLFPLSLGGPRAIKRGRLSTRHS